MEKDDVFNSLWIEKYRPRKFNKVALLPVYREKLNGYVQAGSIPHLMFEGPPGSGKEQPIHSRIITPNGYVYFANINIGNLVAGSDGNFYAVTKIYERGIKNVYRVMFSDDSYVDCGLEHLWYTRDYKERSWRVGGSVRSTREIKRTLFAACDNRLNHFIPFVEPVKFYKKDLPLNPYLLGLFLGDGCYTISKGRKKGKNYRSLTFTNIDKDILRAFKELLPYGDIIRKNKKSIAWRIVKKKRNNKPTKFLECLDNLGLKNLKSYEKLIPREYLLSSVEDRIWLLRGLMDTDGSVANDYAVDYSTTSERLKDSVKFLVESLGGKFSYYSRMGSYKKNNVRIKTRINFRCHIHFNNGIVPFACTRKIKKYKISFRPNGKYIKNVIKLDIKERMRCISVAAPDGLYITDNFTLTHNTTCARILLDSLNCEALRMNASDERGIDVVRNKVKNFAQVATFKKFKVVFLDEADQITIDAQQALRNTMEQFAKITRFILTCNHVSKIIEAVQSRCQIFHFNAMPKGEMANILETILEAEKIGYDSKDVDKHIELCYPDLRKAINLMQQNIRSGKFKYIDETETLKTIIKLMKKKDIKELRKFLAGKKSVDYPNIYRYIYDNIDQFDQVVRLQILWDAAEYLYRDGYIIDKEMNFIAFCIKLTKVIK